MLLKNLDVFIEDVEYELFEEQEQEQCLWLEKRALHIKEYGVKVRTGYCETWDEECGEYAIDFDFYMFFDAQTDAHLYEEAGSSLEVCIYNYLRSTNKQSLTMEKIQNLKCEIIRE